MTHANHIGLLTPGWPGQNTPNGIASSVYHLAMGLREIGHKPVILALKTDGTAPPDIPVVPVPFLPWRWIDRMRGKLGDKNIAHQHIAQNITSAFHTAHASYPMRTLIMEETNGWAGWVQAQVPVPVVTTLHGPWTLLKTLEASNTETGDTQRENRENRTFRSVAGLISPSRNVLAAVEAANPGLKTPRIVLPNSLQADPQPELAGTAGNKDILFVGRFARIKGGDTVLEAFARLVKAHPDARLTFAGPDIGLRRKGKPTIHIDEILAKLPEATRNRIDYRGAVGRAEVASLRKNHSISLIASRFENLNYTLLEAMAAGQGIVCTAVGGPAEVLEHEKTALLVPPGDPDAMATALGRLLDDPDLKGRLAKTGHAKLQSDFSPKTVATQTVAFLDKILT